MDSRRFLIGLPVLMMLAFSSITTISFTWYVTPDGNDADDCLTPSTPCRTIQATIVKASSGDYISIAAGTYSSVTNGESYPINIDKSLDIFGKGADLTILDASASGQNVFHANGCLLDIEIYQFTIQGGNRGIEFIGDHENCITGEITNNKILSNSMGIFLQGSNVDITTNDILENSTHGIHCYSSRCDLNNNSLSWNGSGGSSAAIYLESSNGFLTNNVMGWNNGSGVDNNNSSPTIINNTIAYNYGGSGIANFNSSSPDVISNIVVTNGVYGIHQDATSSPTCTYNDVWLNSWGNYYGAVAGTGSISADPRFVSVVDGHLLCSSPAINTGYNGLSAPAFDYDWHRRPVGGLNDMGAYERTHLLYCGAWLPTVVR